MSLSSFFQRFRRASSSGQASATDAVSSIPSDVEAARVRARRRLIGMAVLVGAGLIGFPWLFETQPRSMSQDVQVVQAASAGGGNQAASTAPSTSPSRSVTGRVAVAGIVPAPAEIPVEQETPTARDESEPKPTSKPEPKVESKAAAAKPADKTSVKPVTKPPAKEAVKEAKETTKPAAGKDASKPASKPADKPATRYVVQFGAFAEVNAAHEARMKVERLGAKTYAQQVDTPAGKRIRVRLGPFSDKAEADKAMATVRKAGLTGALLTL